MAASPGTVLGSGETLDNGLIGYDEGGGCTLGGTYGVAKTLPAPPVRESTSQRLIPIINHRSSLQ